MRYLQIDGILPPQVKPYGEFSMQVDVTPGEEGIVELCIKVPDGTGDRGPNKEWVDISKVAGRVTCTIVHD